MTVTQFAQLLGVHLATAYRWEAAREQPVQIDPLQLALLVRIDQGLRARQEAERQQWARTILEGLLIGGTLVGLALLLEELAQSGINATTEKDQPRGRRKK